jgi:hypothetical protein
VRCKTFRHMHTERQMLSDGFVPGSEDLALEPQAQTTNVGYSRSRQMVSALRREFLYSEKRVRDALFRVLADCVTVDGPPRTVSRLAREAALLGRRRAVEIGLDPVNWDIAAKATTNAMLGAGVLMDPNGVPIPWSISAQATAVTGLLPEYVDRTEAYLLEVLIRKLGDITSRDHTALAHALFRQFDRNVSMEELEDRVVVLLASLADRIGLGNGGSYFPLTTID